MHTHIQLEEMTEAEYRNGGAQLEISYGFAESIFGPLIVAATAKGVCHLAFYDGTQEAALQTLQQRFPNARYQALLGRMQQHAIFLFTQDWEQPEPVTLHVKGTPFQLKVWEALLRIPKGQLSTYGTIAGILQQPNASRAVGTAIGDNPVAFLIPCHRVIRASGELGGYHWGLHRKKAMIAWELAH